ncbi:MAG: bifunctional glutamate N-acetyltransferase/amino-acid acetyltransferase ArgJ [Armatimonadetes bacterium]|nr:bifunctional glutamate N-acetyltransferase/amino-acid acetyltransferase ArgJ [Armatimonadota bacterium]
MTVQDVEVTPGGALAAKGFRGASIRAGIKGKPVPDMSLLVSDEPCSAAGTFTRNRFRAAPVQVCEEHLADGRAQAVIANSGNANCATGAQGLANARRMAELAGQALGLRPADVLVCSTGAIGYQLPMAKIEAAIPELAARLGRDDPQGLARGIMTTDTRPKMYAVAFELGGREVRLGGIAKGAGMIAPNMATMLSFITTDAALEPAVLRDALRWAVDRSFNCISIEGCTSTNDTVLLLANGASGAVVASPVGAEADLFRRALLEVCRELAKMIAGDGEGATKLISIHVTGGRSFLEARRVAKAVADYTLLKIAIHGEQFNWGRLVAAIGASLAAVDPDAITAALGGLTVWQRGEPARVSASEAVAALSGREVAIEIDLGQGGASAEAWTCDISEEFIAENVAYEGPADDANG